DLPFPLDTQNDLGWGSGGGAKLTWQPDPTGWNLSAAIRYGRAHGATQRHSKQALDQICISAYGLDVCDDPSSGNIYLNGHLYHSAGNKYNYTDTRARNEEGHTIVDFEVGKDVGLGVVSSRLTSHLDAGLRYADLKSSSAAVLHGRPDLYLNLLYLKYPPHFHKFGADIVAQRKFEGVGPVVNFDTDLRLFGAPDAAGQVDLELGLGGGVLFGRQTAHVRGRQYGAYRSGFLTVNIDAFDLSPPYNDAIDLSRSKNVSVPTVNANLGLSYTLGGVKVSGGYRMERYYKVIDGGYMERKAYDRNVDGVYAKVSIGFGG
ncbi:MAG: Lpg1974 family pore-forming outer membrane protein, partial [Ignavibacteriales bacterium]